MNDAHGLSSASVLMTDMYQLTMLRAYYAEGMTGEAVFELYTRDLPDDWHFLVTAGLPGLLDDLASLRFTSADLEALRRYPALEDERFLNRLADWRFTGEIYAMPEGTICFANEPILQVVAPLPEAQLIETLVMNRLMHPTLAASKAARMVLAAGDRAVVDFSARRSHGIDAAMQVARSSYLAGFHATATVAAGAAYDIPITGTMAHSYIQSHDDEYEALKAFARIHGQTTLLIDTYDTLQGIDHVIRIADELGESFQVKAVRLDSGDLLELSREARKRLDQAGLEQVQIFASGGLDEHRIDQLVSAEAPIDGFGVGTTLGVIRDCPALDCAYKLMSYAGQPRIKLSSGKAITPGRKQIFRSQAQGRMTQDTIARFDESGFGTPLLVPVFRGGQRIDDQLGDLKEARERVRGQLAILPESLCSLKRTSTAYPVNLSAGLAALRDRVIESVQ